MSSWDQANSGENLGLFGEIERKLAKLSMTTFTYHSYFYLFYGLMERCLIYDEKDPWFAAPRHGSLSFTM
jgi:hypothetical protein